MGICLGPFDVENLGVHWIFALRLAVVFRIRFIIFGEVLLSSGPSRLPLLVPVHYVPNECSTAISYRANLIGVGRTPRKSINFAPMLTMVQFFNYICGSSLV